MVKDRCPEIAAAQIGCAENTAYGKGKEKLVYCADKALAVKHIYHVDKGEGQGRCQKSHQHAVLFACTEAATRLAIRAILRDEKPYFTHSS